MRTAGWAASSAAERRELSCEDPNYSANTGGRDPLQWEARGKARRANPPPPSPPLARLLQLEDVRPYASLAQSLRRFVDPDAAGVVVATSSSPPPGAVTRPPVLGYPSARLPRRFARQSNAEGWKSSVALLCACGWSGCSRTCRDSSIGGSGGCSSASASALSPSGGGGGGGGASSSGPAAGGGGGGAGPSGTGVGGGSSASSDGSPSAGVPPRPFASAAGGASSSVSRSQSGTAAGQLARRLLSAEGGGGLVKAHCRRSRMGCL